MNNSKGFTLIELVIVIVILGILAATAAPKFIDLTGDARESVMKGVEGSINSAVEIAHAKALIEGETASDSFITIDSVSYATPFGWPSNDSIIQLVEISDNEIIPTPNTGAPTTFSHDGSPTADSGNNLCTIEYDATGISNPETRPLVGEVAGFEC